jgi:peptidoglycan/LPS O-acetylase OafA/YrhL
MFNFIPGRHESIVPAGWTIGVEMIFYAVLPVILAQVSGLAATALFCVIAIAISVSARAVLPGIEGLPANYTTLSFISNLQYFAIGVLAYQIFKAAGQRRVSDSVLSIIGFITTIILLFAAVKIPSSASTGMNTPFWGLLFGALCVWQALVPGACNASGPFVYLGERSYSIYLVHPMVILLPRKQWEALDQALDAAIGRGSFLVIALLVLSITFALASVTYRWIEVPGIRFGSRLIRSRPASLSESSERRNGDASRDLHV